MAKRVSELAQSLKQLGDIQVTDWDFMELLNTDIKDLELSQSLKRLGSVRVMDWDFRTVLPAVKKVANQEVDVIDIFKRTASYKVLEWDFKAALLTESKAASSDGIHRAAAGLSPEEMQALILRLKNFVQFVAVNLIDEPGKAQIKMKPMGSAGLRLKLILVKKDLALLIGREGFTAAAIRNIVKATAAKSGVQALLQIHSHEDEAAELAKEEMGRRSH